MKVIIVTLKRLVRIDWLKALRTLDISTQIAIPAIVGENGTRVMRGLKMDAVVDVAG